MSYDLTPYLKFVTEHPLKLIKRKLKGAANTFNGRYKILFIHLEYTDTSTPKEIKINFRNEIPASNGSENTIPRGLAP